MKDIKPSAPNRILASAQKAATASPQAAKARKVQSQFDATGSRMTTFEFEKVTYDRIKHIRAKLAATTGETPTNKEIVELALIELEKKLDASPA